MRIITIAFLLCISVTTIQAQKFSIRYSLGVANYAGDLQANAYTFNQCQLAGGLGVHYEISNHFTARADFYLGRVSAADRHSSIPLNVDRNLEFTSGIEDFTLTGEYDFLSLKKWKVTPYIFAGFGVYHFNPYTSDQLGNKVYLRTLGTEGQGLNGNSKYNLTQLNIPYGAGIKFAINDNIRVGVEVGFRKLFTDYLDDVSTVYAPTSQLAPGTQQYAYRGSGPYPTGQKRGNSANYDDYYFTQLTLSLRLVSHKESDFTKMEIQMVQCPTNMILY